MFFRDRQDAGRRVAHDLASFRGHDVVVLGLPRGGVIVAAEVARALGAPLDVLVSRKIGLPGHPELGMGAVAPGAVYLDRELIHRFGVSEDYVRRAIVEQTAEIARQDVLYRGRRPPLDLTGKVVILVDDGLATGATARAAIDSIRVRKPRSVHFAAPVCEAENAAAVRERVDGIECLHYPVPFRAVGSSYDDFSPTPDEDVLVALAGANREAAVGLVSRGAP